MLKEIKYFLFILIIVSFVFFSVKIYVSEENTKKTFRNLSLIDKNISSLETDLPIILSDTKDIVRYLSNDENFNKKKYLFWELLNSDD